MTETAAALDDQAFMSALFDLVIPPSASGELPGAGALDLSPAVATALRADPLLGPLIEAGVQAVREAALSGQPDGLAGMTPEAGTKVVDSQLTSSHPMLIMGLARYLYPAYYQHPRVLEGIGEAPRPPFPEGFDVEATDAGLLEKLQARRKTQ
jgi:hypothetical protein